MASSADTVSKCFHNYTCSHMVLSESGVSTEERFDGFVVGANSHDLCIHGPKTEQNYNTVNLEFMLI